MICTTNLTPKIMPLTEAMKLNDEQKLLYFDNAKVPHESIKSALSELQLMTSRFSGSPIVFLIGTTGVGKTFLKDLLVESIITKCMSDMNDDPSYIPVISVEAPSSGERTFSWSTFYDRIGYALQEVLMQKKCEDKVVDGRYTVKFVTNRSTIAARREAVEAALGYRKTSLLITDEAIHLMRDKEGNALARKMDTLKSLANINGTTILLIGSYDLYHLMNQSGQVARRSTLVHFERYSSAKQDDVNSFSAALDKLQKALPIKNLPDLKEYAKQLILPCAGCIGTLKDTLQRALIISLNNHEGKWNKDCLSKALQSKAQIEKIEEESHHGETLIGNAIFGSNTL
jgi:hypothetical protein